MVIYAVKPGDSVFAVARRYGMSPQAIIRDNGLVYPDTLTPGQTLVLMTDTVPHTVTGGQTLTGIARAYGVPLQAILEANPQITNPDLIYPGQVIRIPVPAPPRMPIYVNGYALPGIDGGVLAATLPHLTYLSVFSYQVRPDGTMAAPDDAALVASARRAGVAPMMVITNIGETGSFSSDLAHAVLTDAAVRRTLIDHILLTLRAKDYYGLNIDFEYVYPQDGAAYDAFLRTISAELRAAGYILATALAPKLSAGQPGLLYEAHHYPAHGIWADHVILMTYEWGYAYGPPMAVAPVDQVRLVLDYAVTAIPAGKILMGMPNYGYDWTLPYRRGTAARSRSNTAAVELAIRMGSVIEYNEASQAPYFYYTDDTGARHLVYFDDARSTRARLRLVRDYGLGGVSYWTVNQYFPQNWLVLESMYVVRKALPPGS